MKIKGKIAIILLFSLCLGMFYINTPSYASSKHIKKTLYIGEKLTIKKAASNSFKTAKSSNKKVVTVKKTASKITMTAKKKGSATITIKTKYNVTYKYKITVIKAAATWKAYTPYNVFVTDTNTYTGYSLVEVVNKTGVYSSSATLEYKIYGVSGNVISSGSTTVSDLLPNAKVHTMIGTNSLPEKVKKVKITKITLEKSDQATKWKYMNRNKYLSLTETSKDDIHIVFNIKNNLSEAVSGTADIVFYRDTACKYPIGLAVQNIYTIANGTNNVSVGATSGYKAYKVYKRAYTSKWVG